MENKVDDEMESGKPKSTVQEGEKEEETASEASETAETEIVPEAEDISEIIEVLNSAQKNSGGNGDITDVPQNLRGSIKYLIEKLIFVRDLYQDPLWLKILDDMADQKEDGKTPSLLVAVARNIPLEDLQDLADNENYEEIQGAVDQRLEADKEAKEKESGLYAAFQKSQNEGKAYCQEMGYDDAEMQDLFALAMDWFKILGDGNISKDDWARIDKMRNYDNDTKSLRDQLPAEPVKEVLPDKSSIQQAQAPTTVKQEVHKPTNSIEAFGMAQSATPDYSQVGKRKFVKS